MKRIAETQLFAVLNDCGKDLMELYLEDFMALKFSEVQYFNNFKEVSFPFAILLLKNNNNFLKQRFHCKIMFVLLIFEIFFQNKVKTISDGTNLR